MTKRCRNKVRNRGTLVRTADTQMVQMFAYMQPTESWRGWTRFQTLTRRSAEAKVAAGKAERVNRMVDGVVQTVYRATRPEHLRRRSAATLTFGTMVAVGNHVGEQSDVKVTRGEQLHYEKFVAWPLIGDTRAVAVRPRMSIADIFRAQRIFRMADMAA